MSRLIRPSRSFIRFDLSKRRHLDRSMDRVKGFVIELEAGHIEGLKGVHKKGWFLLDLNKWGRGKQISVVEWLQCVKVELVCRQ